MGKPTQKGIKLEQKEGKRKMKREKKWTEKRGTIRKKEEKIEQILKKKGQKKSNTSGESRRYIKRKSDAIAL